MKQDCVGGLMETAMENIKSMVEVNTIIGDAVETPGGTVIIPVSKMCCGFASGGTHMVWDKQDADGAQHPPFGGGAGAGAAAEQAAAVPEYGQRSGGDQVSRRV